MRHLRDLLGMACMAGGEGVPLWCASKWWKPVPVVPFYHAVWDCLRPDIYTLKHARHTMCAPQNVVALYQAVNANVTPCAVENSTPPPGWRHPALPIETVPGFSTDAPFAKARAVFIQRSSTRHWDNINAFTGAVPPGKVDVYTEKMYAPRTFRDACLIVGYHGAGLVNAVFAQRPVCVYELSIRIATNYRWRSNCKSLATHPAVQQCTTMYLHHSALVHLNRTHTDIDHHIKDMPRFAVPDSDTLTVSADIAALYSRCCTALAGYKTGPNRFSKTWRA